MNLRRILSQAALVIGALVFSIGLQAYAASFAGPTQGFPNGDAQAPLDTGPNANVKAGGLVLNSGGALNGLLVANGNVGIGTVVSPLSKLHTYVTGNNNGAYIEGNISGNYQTLLLSPDSTVGAFVAGCTKPDGTTSHVSDGCGRMILQGTGSEGFRFQTSNAASGPHNWDTKMVIKNSGNVGIGTTDPTARLEVNGSIKIPSDVGAGRLDIGGFGSYLARQASDGSTILQTGQAYLLLNPTGSNVGIGVVSPATKLDVAGAIKVGDSATCGAAQAGAIRYNSGNFQGCNGSAWVPLSGPAPSGSQTWGTPGTYSFTVPAGVSVISITAAGGGGAGGCGGGSDKNLNGGGGGGGGAGSIGTRVGYAVTQGEVFNLIVGIGGINPGNCGGNQFTGNGANGNPGQSSSVTKVSTGAVVVSGTLGSGGSSGIYSSGTPEGSPGANCPPYGTGGPGAGGINGAGGAGGTCSGGGGGGGGNTSSNTQGAAGGAGGAGFVTISW